MATKDKQRKQKRKDKRKGQAVEVVPRKGKKRR